MVIITDLGNVVKLHLQHTKGDIRQATSPSSEQGSPGKREEKHRLEPWRPHNTMNAMGLYTQ